MSNWRPLCPTHQTPMRKRYTGVETADAARAEWVWRCPVEGCGKWKVGGVELKHPANWRPKR